MHLTKYQIALYHEIFVKREYALLDDIILHSETFFDVGSNIGLFSAYVLFIKKFVNIDIQENQLILEELQPIPKDLHLHLFEPNPETFDRSRDLLSFAKQIDFNNVGIFSAPTTQTLRVPEIDCQASLYESFLTQKGWSSIQARFTSLPEYFEKYHIERIDLLKMDVEWAEFEILLNLDCKYFDRIKVLFLEYHLLDGTFQEKFDRLLQQLNWHFEHVEVIKGQYTEKIGYVWCRSNYFISGQEKRNRVK